MKKWLALWLCTALIGCAACAFAQIPLDVLEYIRNAYPEQELEDYLALPGLQAGEYAFALVRENGVRTLLGFRWREGRMENWLASSSAVPQTDRQASFYRYETGEPVTYVWDEEGEYRHIRGENFGVSIPDEWGEAIESEVYYEWENGAFRLRSYRNRFWDVDVFGDTFFFWDIGNGLRNVIDTDVPRSWNIRDVAFDALPIRAEDIAQKAHHPPEIPRTFDGDPHALCAETYRFAPDQKYPVYNGPGKQYQRAGNGKATVGTNGWIQVFGEHDGYLMIQYAISDDRCRIGWITRDALPRDQAVDRLAFSQDGGYTLSQACVLTDDPLCSRSVLCEVPRGVSVEKMAELGYAWAYVRVTVDGETWWGFLPDELLERE